MFADRLKQAMERKGLSTKDLVLKSKRNELESTFGVSQVGNWISGAFAPGNINDLKLLANLLDVSIDYLLGNERAELTAEDPKITIPGIEYHKINVDVVSKTEQELWIHLRTGTTYYHNSISKVVEDLMQQKGISVRLLICSPNHEPTKQMIVDRRKRNSRSRINTNLVTGEIEQTIEQLLVSAERAKVLDKVSIRTIEYYPPYLLYLVDPVTEKGAALALISNYQHEITESPMIFASKTLHMRVFDYFVEDFQRLWNAGSDLNPKDYLSS